MNTQKSTLFTELGGKPTLQKVHKIFYDKLYKDPWMSQFFKGIDQNHIESQQTDFMTQAMGGPENYFGAFPIPAHKHMNITEELFEYRHKLLRQSLQEAGVSADLAERWLKIDGAFRNGIVKKSFRDCQKKYADGEILDFPNPFKKTA